MEKINFKTANFGTLSKWLLSLHDGIHGIHRDRNFVIGISQNNKLSIDEKCKVFDIIKSQSTIRLIDNPRSFENFIFKSGKVENTLPQWCDAQKALIMATTSPEAPKSPDYSGLYDNLNHNKVKPNNWKCFIDFIEKHRNNEPIVMARIALILHTLNIPAKSKIGWVTWYKIFCNHCGVEVNNTYMNDKTKLTGNAAPLKVLHDELMQTDFIKDGGDAMSRPHVGYNDAHGYKNHTDGIGKEINDMFGECCDSGGYHDDFDEWGDSFGSDDY